MRFRDLAVAAGVAGAATFLYGMLVESNRLAVARYTLPLPGWPERLRGYRIAVLGDLHIRGPHAARLAERAIALAIAENPDMVALVGDFVGVWTPEMPKLVGDVLEPLLLMEGNVVAIPGNHDYDLGTPEPLVAICSELNIRFLRNEVWRHAGIAWVGIDSLNAYQARPEVAMAQVEPGETAVVLWHEPDAVDMLPEGAALMLAGHSHGGQFRFPGGFTPVYSGNGRKYPREFYPYAPTPLFVTRGIGTTGFPSRLNCPPEVALLTLIPG